MALFSHSTSQRYRKLSQAVYSTDPYGIFLQNYEFSCGQISFFSTNLELDLQGTTDESKQESVWLPSVSILN